MDSAQQVVAGVYTLLRRPSQAKLAYKDVLKRMNDNLRGYTQDMNLNGRQQRTAISDVRLVRDDIDYKVLLSTVPDFEPVRLEYSPGLASSAGDRAWYEAITVPFEAWEHHYSRPHVAASFYGSSGMPEGVKVKLNMGEAEFGDAIFRMSYRMPLLTIVQMGERPPIPSDFIPMLELDTGVDVAPLVRDYSAEWKAWMKEILPIYIARAQQWNERWKMYLEESLEPVTQPIKPFNDFRRGSDRQYPRAYLPLR